MNIDNTPKTDVNPARVVHVLQGAALRYGGTASYVAKLANMQAGQGMGVQCMYPVFNKAKILNEGGAGAAYMGEKEATFNFGVPANCLHALPGRGPEKLGCAGSKHVVNKLNVLKPSVVHIHGLWLNVYHQAAKWAAQHNVPYIVSVHGMLEPWALKRSALAKKVLWAARFKGVLQRAAGVHVATQREAEHIRTLGITAPINVVPSGLAFPEITFAPHGNYVLSLGRLHPVKGLDFFARAWAQYVHAHPGTEAKWVLAGSCEGGTQAALQALLVKLKVPESNYAFVGAAQGAYKAQLLAGAACLVNPSRMESFGLSILEALAHGTPVLASTACAWQALEAKQCGQQLGLHPADMPAWAAALGQYLSAPAAQQVVTFNAARAWVGSTFSPEATYGALKNIYAQSKAR